MRILQSLFYLHYRFIVLSFYLLIFLSSELLSSFFIYRLMLSRT